MSSLRSLSLFQSRPRISIILLYLGFLTTGAMTVLLGTVLPRIAAEFHLSDSQSGLLLMAMFASSSSGALFVRRRFRLTLGVGYLMIPVAGSMLAVAPRQLGLAAIAVFGLGLGMAMTSTSMLVGRMYPGRRGAALSFLNFCWSIGSTLCPLLIAKLHGNVTAAELGVAVALVAGPFAILPLIGGFEAPLQAESRHRPLDTAISTVVLFAIAGFLYVGMESSVGNWMTTYGVRVVSWSFTNSSLATACFWGALLAGRGLAPIILYRMHDAQLFRLSVFSLVGGLLLLVSAHTPWALLAGAAWTGFSLGPIYPLVLALFMERAGESKHTGWIFTVSGFGGAVLPWMTGVISSAAHSLRIGLMVPVAGACLLIVLMLGFGLSRVQAAASTAAD
ncbi:MAG: MFS transporter [Acidobacteriaceae bacterium]